MNSNEQMGVAHIIIACVLLIFFTPIFLVIFFPGGLFFAVVGIVAIFHMWEDAQARKHK